MQYLKISLIPWFNEINIIPVIDLPPIEVQ